MPSGLTARRQADLLIARLHGLPERAGLTGTSRSVPTLAQVLPHRAALPALPEEPNLCRLDPKGRFKLAGLADRLSWRPGRLTPVRDGRWVVLSQPGAVTHPVRNYPRLGASDRVTVPGALRMLLGVEPGDSLIALPVTGARVLCLINPAVLLLSAPLALLDTPSDDSGGTSLTPDHRGEAHDPQSPST